MRGVGLGDGLAETAGVAAGISISLLTEVRIGRSSAGSIVGAISGSGGGVATIVADLERSAGVSTAPAAPSPAPPFIQTTLCDGGGFDWRLHLTNPMMSATWASPMIVTLRQKRTFPGMPISTLFWWRSPPCLFRRA